jgi:hypothetical protein
MWFPDRTYQAPYFARALLAAASDTGPLETGERVVSDNSMDAFRTLMREIDVKPDDSRCRRSRWCGGRPKR